MSDVQRKFFTVPDVDIQCIADVVHTGKVVLSFDFEGRTDRFRQSAEYMAGKGFASFVRVGNQGNVEKALSFGPNEARKVIDFVLQHPGALAGTSRNLLEVYLIGTSTAASAVAAIADEYEQIAKILLISPEINWGWQVIEGISEFVGHVTILGSKSDPQSSLHSAGKLEECSDLASSRTSLLVEKIDEQTLFGAPFWAFVSPAWPTLRAVDRDTIAPPADRIRIAQLRAVLNRYESPTGPIANVEKKIWALCELLRGEPLSHRKLAEVFYRDAPSEVENTLSVVRAQCLGDSGALRGDDSLPHHSELGYIASVNPDGHVPQMFLAERIKLGTFHKIEDVPVVTADHNQPEVQSAARAILIHYQGKAHAAVPDLAFSGIASKLAQTGNWFLPIRYLEDQFALSQANVPEATSRTIG